MEIKKTSHVPAVMPAAALKSAPCAGVDSSANAVSVTLGIDLMDTEAIA